MEMYESGELAQLFGVDMPDDEEERLEDVTPGPPRSRRASAWRTT